MSAKTIVYMKLLGVAHVGHEAEAYPEHRTTHAAEIHSGGNNGGRQHKALDSEYAESGKQQTLQQHCKQKIYRIFQEYTQFFKIYPV